MKKAILILTILFINSINTFAQTNNIDLKTLEKITEMSSNQFEDWALSKGLTFSEIINYSDFDVVYYKSGKKYQISIAINKDGTSQGGVFYETSNSIEYTNLKKNCTKFGYKFTNSESSEIDNQKRVYHKYDSSNYELSFNTMNSKKFYGFSIGVKNKNIR
ncbi:MAG: hypothetical protein K2Y30_14695 [Flavobacteriaceae bacterium]|nr:hypothetical protein [Flavobacteriaceae bacterium]